MTIYLLDTNVFIEAKNDYYGFDFCPAFWDWLDKQNKAGKIAIIDEVAEELRVGEDDLWSWIKVRRDSFFLPTDDRITPALQTVSNWAYDQNYHPNAVADFLEVADGWLVAHALARGYIVVTQEKPDNAITKIKIPNVCRGLNLQCMTTFEMLRREQARFILAS